MQSKRFQDFCLPCKQGFWRNLFVFLFWGGIFTLSYAQAPLYTSNENQYFLHGLAKAGYGFLADDWLANTLDMTPVFSWLIFTLFSLFHWRGVFYIVFGLLASVFLFGLVGVVKQIWFQEKKHKSDFLFLTMLIVVNSALVRYLFLSRLGASWDYLFDGGVAGQKLLGVVLQPSSFGVFLLVSIYFFLARRYDLAIIFLVIPPIVHPTYLLTSGVLTIVYMGLRYAERNFLKDALWLGVGALAGVFPVILYAYRVFGDTDASLGTKAKKILVLHRIPHHALVSEWFSVSVIVKCAFVLIALFLLGKAARKKGKFTLSSQGKIFYIILWLLLVACGLTAVAYFSGSYTLALIFPWRISTLIVPLSVAVIVGAFCLNLLERFRGKIDEYRKILVAVCLMVSVAFAGGGLAKTLVNAKEKAHSPERSLFAFVDASKERGQTYLTPVKMQDFRLETGAPQFVDFKSIPYKDEEVIEWNRRYHVALRFYNLALSEKVCKQLKVLESEGITHVVVPQTHAAGECPGVQITYADDFYRLIALQGGNTP